VPKRRAGGVRDTPRHQLGELEWGPRRLALDTGLAQPVEHLLPRAGDRGRGIRIIVTTAASPALGEDDRHGNARSAGHPAGKQGHRDLPVE